MRKWILSFLIVFFCFVISLKAQNDFSFNIFVVESAVVLAIYTLQSISRIALVLKIKKKAEKIYACQFRFNSVCKVIFSAFPKHISLHSIDNTLNLILIFVRKKHAKYHFDSKDCVEVYVGNRETYRTGKVRYSIGKNVSWNLKNKINVSCNESAKTVFILTKTPMDITSSDKSANEYLGNGDSFFDSCVVFSKNHFISAQ